MHYATTTADGYYESGEEAFNIEDATHQRSADQDSECQHALVTPRESRGKMNKLRSSRGLVKGKVDGVLDEGTASSGKPHARGKVGGGKGKYISKRRR